VLAEKISHVHEKFGLNGKISVTVTNNGSNFVKAFASYTPLTQDSGSTQMATDDSDDDDEIMETFADMHTLIIPEDVEDDFTQVDYELSDHQICATHTLNLVATSDVDKHLLSDFLSRSVYQSSFGKCSALKRVDLLLLQIMWQIRLRENY